MSSMLLTAAAALRMAWASLWGGTMDGTSWEVKVKADSFFSFPHHEVLVFEKGRLNVRGNAPPGFESGSYRTEPAVDADEVWSASFTSDDAGTVSWQGLVRGDRIEGVAIWWPKDGGEKRYVFSGSRKNA
jgi:hypothetical protein